MTTIKSREMRYILVFLLLFFGIKQSHGHEEQGYISCSYESRKGIRSVVVEYPSNKVQVDQNGDIWLHVYRIKTFNPSGIMVWKRFPRSECVELLPKETP